MEEQLNVNKEEALIPEENYTFNFRDKNYEATIRAVYLRDYIGKHMGEPSLIKKHGYKYFNSAFHKFNLPIRSDTEKGFKYDLDETFFTDINTEEKAYWLGFMMADGYVSHRKNTRTYKFGISIEKKDYEHLVKFKTALKSNCKIKEYQVKSSGYKIGVEYCRILLTSKKVFDDLVSHGCIEHKSDILQPPIGLDEEFEKAFIRGYFDADGCVVINNSKYGPSFDAGFIGTLAMDEWIQDILIKNSIIQHTYNPQPRKEGQKVLQFEFGGNKLVYKYLDWLYGDATIYLDRKYERYQILKQLMIERGYINE